MKHKRSMMMLVCLCIGLTLMIGSVGADHTPDGEKDIRNLTEDSINKDRTTGPFDGMTIYPGIAVEGTWAYLSMNFGPGFEKYRPQPFDWSEDKDKVHKVPTRVEWEIYVDGNRTHQIGGVFDPDNCDDEYACLGEKSGLWDSEYRLPIPEQTDGDVNITVTGATFDRTINLKTKPQIDPPHETPVGGVNDGEGRTVDLGIIGVVSSPPIQYPDRFDDFDVGPDNMPFGGRIGHWVFFENTGSEKIELNRQEDGSTFFTWYVGDQQTQYRDCDYEYPDDTAGGNTCRDSSLVPTRGDLILDPGEQMYKYTAISSVGHTEASDTSAHPRPGFAQWNFTRGNLLGGGLPDNTRKFVSNDQIQIHPPELEDIEILDEVVVSEGKIDVRVTWNETQDWGWAGIAEILVDGSFVGEIWGDTQTEESDSRRIWNRQMFGERSFSVPINDSDSIVVEARVDGSTISTTIEPKTEENVSSPDESVNRSIVVDEIGQSIIITEIQEDAIVTMRSPSSEITEFVDGPVETDSLQETGTYNLTIVGDSDVNLKVEQSDDSSSDDPPSDDPTSDDPLSLNPKKNESNEDPITGNPSSDGAGPGFGIGIVMIAIIVLIGVRRR